MAEGGLESGRRRSRTPGAREAPRPPRRGGGAEESEQDRAQREMDEAFEAARDAAPPEPDHPLDPPSREEGELDPRNFRLMSDADRARGSAAGAQPNYYHYVNPDGSVLTEASDSPDGSPKRFTQEEVERIRNGAPSDVPPGPPPAPPEPRPSPRPLDDIAREFAQDHHNDDAMTPEEERAAYAQRMRQREGARSTQVAREPRAEQEGESDRNSRLTDVADWGNLPPLLQGAKALRQQEIQANPEWERNFLLVVERLDTERGASIYTRSVSGEVMDSNDLAFLKYARVEFANRLVIGESLQKRLEGPRGLADMELVKRRNEAFRNEVELSSDDSKTLGVIRDQAMILAMKMPSEGRDDAMGLNDIVHACGILDKNRNTWTYRRWEKGVQDVIKQSRVPWDKYKEVFKFDDRRSRRESIQKVQQHVRQERRGFERVFGFMDKYYTNETGASARRIVKKAERLEKQLHKPGRVKDVDEQLDAVTKFMYLTLTHDVEVRRAFQQSAMRNEEVAAVETRPATFKEMRQESVRISGNAVLSPNNLKSTYERQRTAEGARIGGRAFADWTPAERKADFMRWNAPRDSDIGALGNSQRAQGERRGSLLATILGLFVGLFIGRHKEQVQFG